MIDNRLSKHIENTLNDIAKSYNTKADESEIKRNTEEQKIKRGTEIKNGKDGLIYSLTFLKDMITLYWTYIVDWISYIEGEDFKNEILYALTDYGKNKDDEEAKEIESIEFKEGLLVDTFSTLVMQINFIIYMLESGSSLKLYQYYFNLISKNLEKINIILKYFYQVAWRNPDFNMKAMDFYDGVITDPVYKGFDFISELVERLKTVDSKWLETVAD